MHVTRMKSFVLVVVAAISLTDVAMAAGGSVPVGSQSSGRSVSATSTSAVRRASTVRAPVGQGSRAVAASGGRGVQAGAAPSGRSQSATMPASGRRAPVVSSSDRRTAPVEESGSAGGVGLTAKIGTLGLGAEATLGMSDYLGVRVGANGYNYSGSRSSDDGTIYGDVQLETYSALLDLHPFGGGFRISGGGMLNRNKITLRADTSRTVELDDQEYWLSDLKGEVTFNKTAPYVGIGYGNAVGADGRWHFSCDFGVMFQGKPKVSAQATASDPALQPVVDDALNREEADVQKDADAFQYYPVIALGVSFRF